jgi:hypothetical protein
MTGDQRLEALADAVGLVRAACEHDTAATELLLECCDLPEVARILARLTFHVLKAAGHGREDFPDRAVELWQSDIRADLSTG